MNDKFVSEIKSLDIRKKLGYNALDQMNCMALYNDALSSREKLCEGGFYSENEMITWESVIIASFYNYSDEPVTHFSLSGLDELCVGKLEKELGRSVSIDET